MEQAPQRQFAGIPDRLGLDHRSPDPEAVGPRASCSCWAGFPDPSIDSNLVFKSFVGLLHLPGLGGGVNTTNTPSHAIPAKCLGSPGPVWRILIQCH